MSEEVKHGFKKLTEEEKQRNEVLEDSLLPKGIINDGGAPTLEVMAINHNRDQYVRNQKGLAKLVAQARDMRNWMVEDMHKCLNPKNIGLWEEVLVENPNFDQNRKPTSTKKDPTKGDNPMFVTHYQPVFNPTKYKDNIVVQTTNSLFKQNEDFFKEVKNVIQEHERQLKDLEQELQESRINNATKGDGVNVESLIDFGDFDDDIMSIN